MSLAASWPPAGDLRIDRDRLTGLYNRSALMDVLCDCLDAETEDRIPVSVILMDIDGFKGMNERLGHRVGDLVLMRVAQRLAGFAPEAMISRVGPDEFMIVMVGEEDEQRASQLAHQCLQTLEDPIALEGGHKLEVSARMGLAASSNPSWLTPTELLRRVDLALYEARDLGPQSLVVFDQRLHDSYMRQLQIEDGLRTAMAENEGLELHVQPIVATNGELSGFEGLLRWQPDDGPSISPGVFIPVAEQSDLALEVDGWVIARGCDMLREWKDDDRLRACTLSLNVSARHLRERGLVELVDRELNRTGVNPGQLVVEIHQDDLGAHLESGRAVLASLRQIGVQVAIAGFGAGRSLLGDLSQIDFDRLKINRNIISELDSPEDRTVASVLVALGRELNLEVVAEGIETWNQFAWAEGAGVTHGQGYLFARATSPDNLEKMLLDVDAELAELRRSGEMPLLETA